MSTGRFLWNELITKDVEGGAAFYEALLGWTRKTMPMKMGDYTMFNTGAYEEAGINVWADAPAHWLSYISVDDLDAACEAIEAAGGTVHQKMNDGEMKFATFSDDQGAVAAVVVGNERPELERRPNPGEFCWYSLMVPDADSAEQFYTKVFGWTVAAMDAGDGHVTQAFFRNGAPIGGITVQADGPPCWGSCVAVRDANDTFSKAQNLGAAVVMPPMPVGKLGKLAMVKDPTGAVISLWENQA